MLVGAHVRAGGDLVGALARGEEVGARTIQVFTQSPRAWKPAQYSAEVLRNYREAQVAHPTIDSTFCHATYLINLASSDSDLLAKSKACLLANLEVATGIGARGLVLHIGSHKGAGLESCVPQIVDSLLEAIDIAGDRAVEGDNEVRCPILLENAAGAGGTVGRSFEELATIIEAAGAGDSIGVCVDTQHLWASGVRFSSPEEASDVVGHFEEVVGLSKLGCVHLNDSKVPFGANRDRHENLGSGTIGAEGLGAFIAHPKIRELPLILEVPGVGGGPRAEDVQGALWILEAGRALWDERRDPAS
ncbi:MAG: deoxyribonuclease IV [Acidimicrobiales bacterium]|jgi:deoxyribonuclease-4